MQRILLNTVITTGALFCFYWVIWLYDSALRDPFFFDGWVLMICMILQILFQLRRKFPALPWGKTAIWMQLHIYMGYFVVGMFVFHTGLSLPDTFLEWALWCLFVIVCISGIIGTYLSRSIPIKLSQNPQKIVFERISYFRSQLAGEVGALAANALDSSGSRTISDLYVNKLHAFFQRPRNLLAHLRNSKRPLQRMCSDIENLERYVDPSGKNTLQALRNLVIAKDSLDFHYAHQGLLKAWLFIHVPATYCLILLSILHIGVMYAYSSGVP